MGTIMGRGWNRRPVVLGLGAISVVLLVGVVVAHQLGATPGRIDPSISAQIAHLVGEWEGTSAPISVTRGGDRYTLTAGRIVLLLRSYRAGVSSEEIMAVQDKVEARARMELGEPSRPTVRAIPSPATMVRSGGWLRPARVYRSAIVAYGFAIGDDWLGVGHTVSAGGAETELTGIHQEALEWFRQQLASQHGSR